MQDPQNAAYTYIISQLKSGLTPDDIAAQLRQVGWDDATIQEAFVQAQTQIAPTPVAPVPAPQQPPANQAQAAAQPDAQAAAVQAKPEPIAESLPPVTAEAQGAPIAQPAARQELPAPITRSRMKTGWLLFKQSLATLKHYPGLWRYLLMTMLWVSITYTIFIVIAVIDLFNSQVLFYDAVQFDGTTDIFATPLGAIFSIAIVYLTTFLTYYYGVGLSSHVLGIFKGDTKTYAEHMGVARKKIVAIAVYALIATVVGYLLRMLEQRFKFVGALVSRVLGAVWALATSFVLPVIADGDESGGRAVGHSAQLFKKTWGETITSRITLGGVVVLLYFVIAMPLTIALGIGLTAAIGVLGVFIATAFFILGVLAIGALLSLATSILNTSLYYYAQHGIIPPTYSPELLASVFYDKKAKKKS